MQSQKKHYLYNKRCIATLYDLYGDNILSQDKQRNAITRLIILDIIGQSEDNIEDGLAIACIFARFLKNKISGKCC